MKKNNYWAFIPFLIFAFFGAMFSFGMWGKRVDKDISPMIGKTLPAVQLPTIDNKIFDTVKENTNAKQALIINFFASWCAPCREEHKQLMQMAADKNVKIIGIAYRDDPKNTKSYIEELGNPYYSIIIDRQGAFGAQLGLSGVPETYIISKDGIILNKTKGEITPKIAQSMIEIVK